MANIDIEMSEFANKTTLANSDYVVVSLENGTQGKIKVSDLASVVAGIINPISCGTGSVSSDFNNYVNSGVYNVGDPYVSISNNPGVNYGLLLVYTGLNGYVIQQATDTDGNTWIRFIDSRLSTFGAWKRLS